MESCSCIYECVDDPIELISDTKRKARKIHVCGECGRDILLGEVYEYHVGKSDGILETHKTCADCLSIRTEFFCDGWLYGMIRERLAEHIGEEDGDIASDCLLRLTPKARADVCELIERVWEESDEDPHDAIKGPLWRRDFLNADKKARE